MTRVITHRGLDPSRTVFFAESSREAFTDHLERGFGIEFDVQPDLTISHSNDTARITKRGDHLISLPDLVSLIREKQKPDAVSALHLKHSVQQADLLDRIIPHVDTSCCIVFDVGLDAAVYIKEKWPEIRLAPSVAHPYDIERYNAAVGGTLWSINDVAAHRELFDWVWLDEWDRNGEGGNEKTLYNKYTFKQIRDLGLKVALVTPELHATSPGLLGGETHASAQDHATLISTIKDILSLRPDAVCTDYPDDVRALTNM